MANTLLTPSVITKEALAVLHQKLNFVGNINRSYDDRYAKSGAKIGNDLKIRKPNEFTVRTGATLNTQDVDEESVTMTVATQKGVDMTFTSEERTMHIDEFKSRYIEPAMSVLASSIESDAFSMYKDVYNFVDGVDSANSFANILASGVKLTDGLAPRSERMLIHDSQGFADVVTDTKGLFNDQSALAKQYREGMIGRVAGFDHYENTIVPSHTTGTAAEGDTSWNIDNASTEFASAAEISANVQTLTVDTGTTTLKVGDILTIANVFRVHPETKSSTGILQQFTVVGNGTTGTDLSSGDTSLQVTPPLITSGPRQNVNAAGANNAAINKIGGGASADWRQSLAFHKDAFAFATADLVMPQGVDFTAREVMDGISMRIVQQYDITNDRFPCRFDVLYGYKTIRPELACRIGHN